MDTAPENEIVTILKVALRLHYIFSSFIVHSTQTHKLFMLITWMMGITAVWTVVKLLIKSTVHVTTSHVSHLCIVLRASVQREKVYVQQKHRIQ